jgi:hypothetical protein
MAALPAVRHNAGPDDHHLRSPLRIVLADLLIDVYLYYRARHRNDPDYHEAVLQLLDFLSALRVEGTDAFVFICRREFVDPGAYVMLFERRTGSGRLALAFVPPSTVHTLYAAPVSSGPYDRVRGWTPLNTSMISSLITNTATASNNSILSNGKYAFPVFPSTHTHTHTMILNYVYIFLRACCMRLRSAITFCGCACSYKTSRF